jgi:hypothetical protein
VVLDEEVIFPVPITLAPFVIDPNEPEVVETVMVEEYDK